MFKPSTACVGAHCDKACENGKGCWLKRILQKYVNNVTDFTKSRYNCWHQLTAGFLIYARVSMSSGSPNLLVSLEIKQLTYKMKAHWWYSIYANSNRQLPKWKAVRDFKNSDVTAEKRIRSSRFWFLILWKADWPESKRWIKFAFDWYSLFRWMHDGLARVWLCSTWSPITAQLLVWTSAPSSQPSSRFESWFTSGTLPFPRRCFWYSAGQR